MKRHPVTTGRLHAQRGFTLVELMIAVVVVALLASIALPSFMDSIRKSRRSEAFAALSAVQQAQERWRGNHASYAGNAQLTAAPSASAPGLGQPATTASGYYGIAISGESAVGYSVTATAVAGTSQASDGNCKVLAARVNGGNLEYGSGDAAASFPDSHRCWAR
ncbi:MAG: prepilin-type N-terminal cleavage/methylation domain-containing protein [Burkholderiaceae bacterium]|jgi:type IV pilus assembly protein PilE|nr:prepilin-type N-terminal cleavage/methylation domain-containing protein [Burkholderiaceae bacterium]